jgi:hypothetical protein
MKITRRQLRRLIETRIKQEIPNIPRDRLYNSIDNLAFPRSSASASADIMAQDWDYPMDRSYSDDLYTYHESVLIHKDMERMRELGAKYADAEARGEPEEYHIRKAAVEEALRIHNNYKESTVWKDYLEGLLDIFIVAFTDGANEYEANTNPSSTFRYSPSIVRRHFNLVR